MAEIIGVIAVFGIAILKFLDGIAKLRRDVIVLTNVRGFRVNKSYLTGRRKNTVVFADMTVACTIIVGIAVLYVGGVPLNNTTCIGIMGLSIGLVALITAQFHHHKDQPA